MAGLAAISAEGQGFDGGWTLNGQYGLVNSSESFSLTLASATAIIGVADLVPKFTPTSADFSVTTVLKPSSLALCTIGLAGLSMVRRSLRQRRS